MYKKFNYLKYHLYKRIIRLKVFFSDVCVVPELAGASGVSVCSAVALVTVSSNRKLQERNENEIKQTAIVANSIENHFLFFDIFFILFISPLHVKKPGYNKRKCNRCPCSNFYSYHR